MKANNIISDLNNHCIEYLKKGDITGASKNIKFMEKLFKEAFIASEHPLNSKIVRYIFNSYKRIIFSLREYEFYEESNNLFLDLCNIIYHQNSYKKIQSEIKDNDFTKNIFSIDIMKILTGIIESVSISSYYYDIKRKKITDLLNRILINCNNFCSSEFILFVPKSFAHYYTIIHENNKMDRNINLMIKEDFIINLLDNIYTFSIRDKDIKCETLFLDILLELSIKSIEYEDYYFFSLLQSKFNKYQEDYITKHNIVRLRYWAFINVNIIYLFILFCNGKKTNLLLSKEMEIRNKKINYNILNRYKKNMDKIWLTLKRTKKHMDRIESNYIESWVMFRPMMRYKAQDFFFFSTISFEGLSLKKISMDMEDKVMLSKFFASGDIKTESDYLNKFYEFTGFKRPDDNELRKRANEFIKYIEIRNEKLP
ncbi:MAG: hypothetical protein HQ534_10800 [Armatimonadetes bacterium]|nr:hypothetical protein [Armatimonadota bacterium]